MEDKKKATEQMHSPTVAVEYMEEPPFRNPLNVLQTYVSFWLNILAKLFKTEGQRNVIKSESATSFLFLYLT
jgi:hypothetical protein